MDAASFALLNAFLQNGAIGTPQVLPAATSDGNTSTSNSNGTSTPNHKSDKEKERRERTNQLFEKLHNLTKKYGDLKMSQASILKAASKAAIEHKRKFHNDHRCRGLNTSLKKVEQVFIQYVESLNLPYPANNTLLQKIEKLFEDFRDVVLPVSTSNASVATPLAPSTSGAPTSSNADGARKEIKKNREQGRRDNLSDGYNSLENFLRENNLLTGSQKIQMLEAIIGYLRNQPVHQLSQTADAELKVGIIQGRSLGQNLVLQFFKNDDHLSAHYDALQSFFISQIGPLNSPTHIDNFQIDDTAIMNFMSIHPAIINFDDIIAHPAPLSHAVPAKFWRPWESQANILKAALKASIKTKRRFHSDHRSRGLNDALEKVEIEHLKSLNLPHPTGHISVQNLKKMFEDFRDVVLPVFTPKAAPA